MTADTLDHEPGELVACQSCDLLHLKTALPEGGKAYCTRCGELLYSESPRAIETALALSLSSLMLFITAHLLPFMTINVEGNETTIFLISTIETLTELDSQVLAMGGIFVLLIAPLMVLLIDVLLLYRLRFAKPGTTALSRQLLLIAGHITPWNMLEIFLLGVLVSIVKLTTMAELTLHQGFWAFVGLVLINLVIAARLHPDTLWRALENREH
ncbi:MAG: paraquat-inducible protein A [Gammaproteobacteria bacterium]|jgi:paraquat-inducible protein A